MKDTLVLILMLGLSMAACKKEEKTDPLPSTPASPYFFKFKWNGLSNEYSQDIPQYMPFYTDEAGGYQVASAALYPSVGLRLSWVSGDTVSESDLLALKGKTLYFSDTTVHPTLTRDSTASSAQWRSIDTANTAFFVKISNIAYLKKDTTAGYYIATYVITGTCNALLSNGTSTATMSDGEFNFIISRRDL